MAETSTKPYMIRALYEWCCDNGYTPYLAVTVDGHTVVPRQYVKGGEIVLNISPVATSRMSIGNERVEFQARFSGVAQELSIPVANVTAIYARENGHGMAFEVTRVQGEAHETGGSAEPSPTDGRDEDHGRPGAPRGDGEPVALTTVPDAPGAPGGEARPARAPRGRARLSDVSARPRGEAGADRPSADDGGAGEGSAEVLAFKSPSARRNRRSGPAKATERAGDVEKPGAASSGAEPAESASSDVRSSAQGPQGVGERAAPDDPSKGPVATDAPAPSPVTASDPPAATVAPVPAAAPQPQVADAGDTTPDGSGGGGRSHLTRIK